MKVIKNINIKVPIESLEDLKKAAEHYYTQEEGYGYAGEKEAYIRGFIACSFMYNTVHPVEDIEDIET